MGRMDLEKQDGGLQYQINTRVEITVTRNQKPRTGDGKEEKHEGNLFSPPFSTIILLTIFIVIYFINEQVLFRMSAIGAALCSVAACLPESLSSSSSQALPRVRLGAEESWHQVRHFVP
jgi:hypothetical protein